MDAHDALSQINERLTTGGKSAIETLTAIDDIVSEYFIQQREELEEELNEYLSC